MKDNKILLVTGASSETGLELIRKVSDDYSVILAHYNSHNDKLKELQSVFGSDKLKLYQADFGNRDDVQKLILKVTEDNMYPDHIVHFPAPKACNKKFHKCEWDDYAEDIQVSLYPFEEIVRAFIPHMVKNKYGKIITMLTSCCINNPPKYQTPYVTAKYALMGMMKSLSVEYADKGITVNGVSPDMMETKFLSDIPDLIIQKNAMENPAGRNLSVEDVVPTFEFLLSDGADMITGQNIAVTGGKQ